MRHLREGHPCMRSRIEEHSGWPIQRAPYQIDSVPRPVVSRLIAPFLSDLSERRAHAVAGVAEIDGLDGQWGVIPEAQSDGTEERQ